MGEIRDFAVAMRQMADNVELLAERHDVAEMGRLREAVAAHAVQARRDADLVEELRRQNVVMGRSLDAIGRLRKTVVFGDRAAVQILADALLLIEGQCSNYTTADGCTSESSGRVRGAATDADSWCDECIARDALTRAGYRGEV